MNQNRISGLIGGLVLSGAVWLPVFSSEIGGQFTLLQFGKLEGLIVLGCGMLAIGFSLINLTIPVRILGLTATGTMAFSFLKFLLIFTGNGEKWLPPINNPALGEMKSLMAETFALEWGWAILLIGVILLLVTGNLKGMALDTNNH